ncbi:Uncharacterized protein TCM_045187 [Theobroma cacao]|uniref:Reverse transcriptase domain-containing protein n=1 Tax=Theobroma cacao TaxID=3641 RepID=A0A061FSY6_THECC|nr:Uncharacterized protein TCM_045187 [Theobroma cacao]
MNFVNDFIVIKESSRDYTPISLVVSIYKIIAKVLENKMNKIIREVVENQQFAFVVRRQLMDCALSANEAVDIMREDHEGGVFFKVNFAKAYDTVSWGFLDFILSKIRRKIGLRQGCPLTLFLFNCVVEAFSVKIRKVLSLRLCKRIEVTFFREEETKVSNPLFGKTLRRPSCKKERTGEDKGVVKEGISFILGNGENLRFWTKVWTRRGY